jgi:hypothetical protein
MAFQRAGLRGEKLNKAVQDTQMAKAKGAATGFSMAFEPGYVEAARTGTIPESTFGKAMLGLETATDLIPGAKLLKGLAAGAAMAGTIYKAGKPVQRTISPQRSRNAKKAIQNVRDEVVDKTSWGVQYTKTIEDHRGSPFPKGTTKKQFEEFHNQELADQIDAEWMHWEEVSANELKDLYTSMYNPQASHKNLRNFKANVIRGLRERNIPNEVIRDSVNRSGRKPVPKPHSRFWGSHKMKQKQSRHRHRAALSDKELFNYRYNQGRATIIDFNENDLRKLREAEDALRRGDLHASDMYNAREAMANARARRETFDINEEYKRSQIARRHVQARRMQHRIDMTRGYGFRYGKNVHPDVTRGISGD